MARRSTKAVVGMLSVLFAVAGWLILARPWESPTEWAYRLCGECGLDADEINQLIDDAAHDTLDRDKLLRLFRETFEDRTDAELCEPCAHAVLDAAGG